jgi:heme/copper-type cytochrome/quinol oxidase subunit 2
MNALLIILGILLYIVIGIIIYIFIEKNSTDKARNDITIMAMIQAASLLWPMLIIIVLTTASIEWMYKLTKRIYDLTTNRRL